MAAPALPAPSSRLDGVRQDPTFLVLPLLMGLDTFTNLLTCSAFFDVALRDVGLLASKYDRPRQAVTA